MVNIVIGERIVSIEATDYSLNGKANKVNKLKLTENQDNGSVSIPLRADGFFSGLVGSGYKPEVIISQGEDGHPVVSVANIFGVQESRKLDGIKFNGVTASSVSGRSVEIKLKETK